MADAWAGVPDNAPVNPFAVAAAQLQPAARVAIPSNPAADCCSNPFAKAAGKPFAQPFGSPTSASVTNTG